MRLFAFGAGVGGALFAALSDDWLLLALILSLTYALHCRDRFVSGASAARRSDRGARSVPLSEGRAPRDLPAGPVTRRDVMYHVADEIWSSEPRSAWTANRTESQRRAWAEVGMPLVPVNRLSDEDCMLLDPYGDLG